MRGRCFYPVPRLVPRIPLHAALSHHRLGGDRRFTPADVESETACCLLDNPTLAVERIAHRPVRSKAHFLAQHKEGSSAVASQNLEG
eukprot:scaffold964_cov261-Pinguiococcus_pyrenoidosus.AAC.22